MAEHDPFDPADPFDDPVVVPISKPTPKPEPRRYTIGDPFSDTLELPVIVMATDHGGSIRIVEVGLAGETELRYYRPGAFERAGRDANSLAVARDRVLIDGMQTYETLALIRETISATVRAIKPAGTA